MIEEGPGVKVQLNLRVPIPVAVPHLLWWLADGGWQSIYRLQSCETRVERFLVPVAHFQPPPAGGAVGPGLRQLLRQMLVPPG